MPDADVASTTVAAIKSQPSDIIAQWLERRVPVADLKPYERNPRRISKERYEKLKSDLRNDGYHDRVLATHDLRIIGGHQRIKALQELGVKEIPVLIPPEPITDAKFREILVKHNLPFGEYDFEMLANDFTAEELVDWGMPKEWLGAFDDNLTGNTDPDDVPAEAAAVRSVAGDVWRLGDHRLMCGDSTKAEDVEKLLDGAKPRLTLTDPPYDFETEGGGIQNKRRHMKEIRQLGINHFDPASLTLLSPTSVYFCNKALIKNYILLAEKNEALWDLCFYKKAIPIPNHGGHLMTDVEYIFVIGKQAPNQGLPQETYSKSFEGKKDKDNPVGWSKPVALIQKFIELFSKNQDVIYEPFSGSGTTIIAGEMTRRKVYAMEISPAYVDMAVMRWQNFTGKEATHAETGEAFNSRVPVSPAPQANPERLEAGK